MTGASGRAAEGARRGPARHERPAIDEAALVAARAADRMVDAARERDVARWAAYLEPMPDALRDADIPELRKIALKARAAYGPKDSIRDVLPAEVTEPFLDAIDRLLKVLARRDAHEG
ncbi:MAG TPA: hypothetical protein VFY23_05560 [Candidatus Limnocylindrales bacterium]|nr:hypothetical protein [Candidatus Limnocylindrales bacterium]